MPGNTSKNKGKSFEREISKYLSELYSDSFQRVFDSGAFTGGTNQKRRATLTEGQIRSHKGDIVPPDDWKYFNCECKSYMDFPFYQLFLNVQIPLLETWIQQLLAAEDPGDCNLLFMKFNRKGRYVMFEKKELFYQHRDVEYSDTSNNNWIFMGFDNFFKLNSDHLKKRCRVNPPPTK